MRLGLIVAVLVAVADQLSKQWIVAFFPEGGPNLHEVTGFFNLVLTRNRGVSYGLFNNGAAPNAVIFSLAAVAIVAGLVWWLRRVRDRWLAIAIGLVIGGAIGNVVDRVIRQGAVVDFLDFHLGSWHWFAFNLADAAISVGVVLMLIDGLRGRREAPN